MLLPVFLETFRFSFMTAVVVVVMAAAFFLLPFALSFYFFFTSFYMYVYLFALYVYVNICSYIICFFRCYFRIRNDLFLLTHTIYRCIHINTHAPDTSLRVHVTINFLSFSLIYISLFQNT